MSSGNFERCSTCEQYGWSGTHRCPPIFLVWCPLYDGHESDARAVRADPCTFDNFAQLLAELRGPGSACCAGGAS